MPHNYYSILEIRVSVANLGSTLSPKLKVSRRGFKTSSKETRIMPCGCSNHLEKTDLSAMNRLLFGEWEINTWSSKVIGDWQQCGTFSKMPTVHSLKI